MNIKEKLKRNKPFMKVYRLLRSGPKLFRYCVIHKTNEAISSLYKKCKLEKKIIFVNFNGKGYGCNPKYIAEEIIRQGLDWDLVWLVNNLEEEMPPQIRKVKFYGWKSYYELASAKVIINNVKGDLNLKKRNGQLYIQTWHAPWGPKRYERQALDKLPAEYVRESKDNSKITDIFLSNSKVFSEEIKADFWCRDDAEIIEHGLPRIDLFFTADDAFKSKIREKLNIGADEKLIMYAPTFRGGKDTIEGYGLDCERVIQTLESRYHCKWKMLLRLHPNVRETHYKADRDNIMHVSKYPDMQELLLITDMLITDVSTCMMEFSVMNKPIFLFANDWDRYGEIRGYKKAFYQLPFFKAYSNDELINALLNIDIDAYLQETRKVKDIYCEYDCGEASKYIIEVIKSHMKNVETA